MSETADEIFRRLYTCTDPDCTAPHVDMEALPKTEGTFVEETP